MKRRFGPLLALFSVLLVAGWATAVQAVQQAPAVPPPELAFLYHDGWWSTGSYAAEASSYRTVAGDFNGDGLDDIAMLHRTNASTARFYVIIGAGDHFGSHTVWLTLNLDADIMTGRVVAGDFDNDGYDDVAAFAKVTADGTTRLYVFTSDGSGFEAAIWWVGSLDYSDKITGRVVAGDFDGDGRADDIAALYDAAADPGDDTIRADVFLSDGSDFTYREDWWSRDRFAAANAQYRTVAGDVDADGDDDVVMVFQAVDFDGDGPDDTVIYVLLAGEGAFSVANWWESDGYIAGRTTGRVVAGDFDGDGDDDVALLYDYFNNDIRGHVLLSTREVFSYQGSQGWWEHLMYTPDYATGRVVAGDWDGNGVDDVSMIYRTSSSSTRAQVLEATAPAPELPATRQVDGDNPACSNAAGAPYCSIQAAVDAANDGDTIQVAGGGYFERVSLPKYSDPGFNQTLTISGAGAAGTFVDGGGNGTVFTVHPGGQVTLSGLTIQNGSTDEFGGGIFNAEGTLIIRDSIVNDNAAGLGGGGIASVGTLTVIDTIIGGNSTGSSNVAFSGQGGGIVSVGTLTVTNSTLSENSADTGAGGIAHVGVSTIRNSTISDNTAGEFGGGIVTSGTLTLTNSIVNSNTAGNFGGGLNGWGVLTVSNSTFSSNNADIDGGGLYVGRESGSREGTMTIVNSTFNANSAGDEGGGIYNYSESSVKIVNSIVANSAAGGDCAGSGTWNTTGGPNLDSDGTCTGFSLTADPLLGPLQDNGGTTQTHALLSGSPAIDAGDNAECPDTDQRAVSRPQDGNGDGAAVCDLGTFEYLSQHFIYLPFLVKP